MKILILNVAIGNGHLQTSKTIRHYCEQLDKEMDIVEVDYLKLVNPFVDKVVVKSYLRTLKIAPKLYGELYEGSKKDYLKNTVGIINKVGKQKMLELLAEVNPDCIVCTHPFPLETIARIKRKRGLTIPSIGVITDYGIHPKWIYEETDAYVVPNKDFISFMKSQNVESDKIYPYGIPIMEDFFCENNEKEIELRNEYGICQTKPTILLMGGGLGLGNIKETVSDILKKNLDLQLVVCCGNNSKLLIDLKKMSSKYDGNTKLIVIGYSSEINVWMSISDVLITKPGGITMTEAMHKKLPMIIMSPIPGQELENEEYLVNSGLALTFRFVEIGDLLYSLFFDENNDSLDRIKSIQSTKVNRNANNEIYNLIKNLINDFQQ